MIKEKTVVIPAQEAKEVKKNLYICDLCGHESEDRGKFVGCSSCGRLVCHWHYGKKGCSSYDPHDWGDYPAEYCIVCYDLTFKKYWKEHEDIENERDTKMRNLEEKIKKESLSYDPAQKGAYEHNI